MAYYATKNGSSIYFSESPQGDAKAREWGLEPILAGGKLRPDPRVRVTYTEVSPGLLRVERRETEVSQG